MKKKESRKLVKLGKFTDYLDDSSDLGDLILDKIEKIAKDYDVEEVGVAKDVIESLKCAYELGKYKNIVALKVVSIPPKKKGTA